MRQKYPAYKWVEADCTIQGALGPSDSYDLVVDKGGVDAMIECQTKFMLDKAEKMIAEIHRVLRPGGKYLLFSNGTQHRKQLLEARFSGLEAEYCEGYSMDLYRKLVFIFVATK